MNKILILKDEAYAAISGGAAIATISDIDRLKQGALAVFDQNGDLVNPAALPGTYEYLIFVAGLAPDANGIPQNKISVPIPVVVDEWNQEDYQAPVKQVVAVGFPTGNSLTFDAVGEYSLVVLDNSYTNKYGVRRVAASGYRMDYMSEEDVVDDVVAKLNVTDSFVVATKVGSDVDGWGVTIAAKEYETIINVSLEGMFEGTPVYTDGTNGSVLPVYGLGYAPDVQQLEKDFSVFEGNANSVEYTEEYFSVPLETDLAVSYEMINILWKGTHASPSTVKNVMNNRLALAGVDGSTIMDNVQTILAGIMTTTKSKTVV